MYEVAYTWVGFFHELSRVVGSIKLFNMSDSSDLEALKSSHDKAGPTTPPSPKQNLAASSAQDRPYLVDSILEADLLSSSAPEQSRTTQTDLGKIIAPQHLHGSLIYKDEAGRTTSRIKSQAPPSASLSKGSKHHTQKLKPGVYSFDNGEEDAGEEEKPHYSIPPGYVPFWLSFGLEAAPQESDLQEWTIHPPVTEEPASQISPKDAIGSTREALNLASDGEAQGNRRPPVRSKVRLI